MKAAETAVSDLQAWRQSVMPTAARPSTDRLEARRALHGLIHAHFDPEELRQLCFDLGVIYGDLGEGGHDDKIRELVLLSIRSGHVGRLLRRLRELRPGVDWPDVE